MVNGKDVFGGGGRVISALMFNSKLKASYLHFRIRTVALPLPVLEMGMSTGPQALQSWLYFPASSSTMLI